MSKATATATKKETALTTAKSTSAIVENLTEEQVRELQKTAQDRILEFDDAVKTVCSKASNNFTVVTVNSDNEVRVKRDNINYKLCYKSTKHMYTCYMSVVDLAYREKLLKAFKDSETVHTCKTDTYLNSATKYLQIIVECNDFSTLERDITELFDKTADAIKSTNKASKKQA